MSKRAFGRLSCPARKERELYLEGAAERVSGEYTLVVDSDEASICKNAPGNQDRAEFERK